MVVLYYCAKFMRHIYLLRVFCETNSCPQTRCGILDNANLGLSKHVFSTALFKLSNLLGGWGPYGINRNTTMLWGRSKKKYQRKKI